MKRRWMCLQMVWGNESLGRIRSILDAQMYLDFDKSKWHLQFSPCQLLPPRNWWFLLCTICHWSDNETKPMRCRSEEFEAYSTIKCTSISKNQNGIFNSALVNFYYLEINDSWFVQSAIEARTRQNNEISFERIQSILDAEAEWQCVVDDGVCCFQFKTISGT